MSEKTCLVIYFGNGFSKNQKSYNGEYSYSVDMRDNKENHNKLICSIMMVFGSISMIYGIYQFFVDLN
jgi:hypothetical protein